MNRLSLGFALVSLFVASGPAEAVTITSSGLTVSTTVVGNTVSANPGSQQISGGGSLISAQADALAQTSLGGGSWEFNGLSTSALLSATRGNNGTQGLVSASASVIYTIAFTLGVGESADVSFDLDYTLQESGTDGIISWNLAGPQSGFAGSVTTAASGASISTQQVSLSTSGNYVFTLSGSIPGSINRNQSAGVTLSNVDFSIVAVAVPEPGAAMLAASGFGLLVFPRRRRIPA